jgi:hypothetical protein
MATVTDRQLKGATELGQSAGAAYRATGVPRRNPFAKVGEALTPLRDAWIRAYVAAAYKRHP